jgi:hypothetical protein
MLTMPWPDARIKILLHAGGQDEGRHLTCYRNVTTLGIYGLHAAVFVADSPELVFGAIEQPVNMPPVTPTLRPRVKSYGLIAVFPPLIPEAIPI